MSDFLASKPGRLVLVALCLLGLGPWHTPPSAAGSESLAYRLLGPIASLAASAQWVRYDLALRDGNYELAYARAETALALDRGASEGWTTLAGHLIFDRGTLNAAGSPEGRRRWIQSGLDLIDQGAPLVRDPEALEFLRGTVYAHLALQPEEDLGWPGGSRAALLSAAAAFDRSAALGHPEAAGYADNMRDLAAK